MSAKVQFLVKVHCLLGGRKSSFLQKYSFGWKSTFGWKTSVRWKTSCPEVEDQCLVEVPFSAEDQCLVEDQFLAEVYF